MYPLFFKNNPDSRKGGSLSYPSFLSSILILILTQALTLSHSQIPFKSSLLLPEKK